jgi:hypothetical protein
MVSATVTAPEMIGLLAWWSVVLAAPVVLVRRWRRRRRRRGVAPHTPRLRQPLQPLGRRREAETVRERPATPTVAIEPSIEPVEPVVRPDRVAAGERPGSLSSANTTRAAASPDARRSRPARLNPGRLSSETLEPLCRYVDFRRRLEVAARELAAKLVELPADRWRIEPYPLTGERRNTFLVIGETGIFVISATYAPGHWDDVIAVTKLARKIRRLLPGYPGQVRPAVCHPFTATRPRIWHRPDEHGDWVGAWLIGGDSVIEWLEHFGPDHGLNAADLARFDELARPNWLKGAIPTPPSWPPIPDAAAPDSQE